MDDDNDLFDDENEDDEDKEDGEGEEQEEDDIDQEEFNIDEICDILANNEDINMSISTDGILTRSYMSKYEVNKIIGVRAQQISKGDDLFIDLDKYPDLTRDPLSIAHKELTEKKLPFIIKRKLPGDKYEYRKIDELLIIED